MIGNLTIDKASMNISYFLCTIRIIENHSHKIARDLFVAEMASFIGLPAKKDGKENRTPYNKSKLPRYFGFVDVFEENETSFLILTNRGKQLSKLISEKETEEANEKYFISPENRGEFIDLIFESVIFGSFGKNNCGAEQSNTDVEPPKIVFKTIYELKRATADEICFVIYGLNKGDFKTFDEAIISVKSKRSMNNYDYTQINEDWGITNIVGDCKIIRIFVDTNISLLNSYYDETIGKTFYSLSNNLSPEHIKQIIQMKPVYEPLRLLMHPSSNDVDILEWVNNVVLGGVSDNSFVFDCKDKNSFMGKKENNTYTPGILDISLKKAYKYPKKNVYLILECSSENDFIDMFGENISLLEKIDDLSSSEHGWSKKSLSQIDSYNYVFSNQRINYDKITYGNIRFPSNLQIVGVIKMEENKNLKFDYEFSRCKVGNLSSKENTIDEIDESERVPGGTNIILYGVPGAGKSWTIENEYKDKDTIMRRLVFHPDYTYSDFVGQILPKKKGDDISYDFIPGPFTKIMCEAYHNPKQKYILDIEEINRGNAPAIFGDIFQLLDRDKKGNSSYQIKNADIAREVFGDENRDVFIPSNLTLLCTMNTSDQNVFTLDTAFQRRWNMRLIENSFKKEKDEDRVFAEKTILDSNIKWEAFCNTINAQILEKNQNITSSEDKRLGTHFVTIDDLIMLDENDTNDGKTNILMNRRFPEKVIKYLWDDAFKFYRDVIFRDELNSLEKVIKVFTTSKGDSRFDIFKDNIKLAIFDENKR